MSALKEAIKRKDEFLKEHPELKEVQDMIDQMNMYIEDPKERMQNIQECIRANLQRLRTATNELDTLSKSLKLTK